MLLNGTLATARVSALITAILFSGCTTRNHVNPRLDNEMPRKIVWAWERPEDLRFLDPNEFGVAFLAQTIFLKNDRVIPNQRRQPLAVPPGAYLIAVTRIETNKEGAKRPTFDAEMAGKVAGLIRNTLELPGVKGIQVDFDAASSERSFYRAMMKELAAEMDRGEASDQRDREASNTHNSSPITHHSLTMTALASWCTGDAWFNDFPVDEAVPMVFQMGADEEKIKTYLRNGNDWREPLCRGSYGLSIDDAVVSGIKPERRVYYFSNDAWNPDDLKGLPNLR